MTISAKVVKLLEIGDSCKNARAAYYPLLAKKGTDHIIRAAPLRSTGGCYEYPAAFSVDMLPIFWEVVRPTNMEEIKQVILRKLA